MDVRLRQVVLAVAELEPVAEQLGDELGLIDPFADPGVAAFGLRNAVFALGDTFVEVVSPIRPDTAAGRYMQRKGGDCGYMLIFQFDDLDAARARVDRMGIRVVWRADHLDISGTHLHPADMRGAIVSLDRADPPGSWRWAGPAWTGREATGAPGTVVGAGVRAKEADVVAARWAEVLGAKVTAEGRLELDGGFVELVPCATEREEGLSEVTVVVPPEVRRGRHAVEIGGVRFVLRPA